MNQISKLQDWLFLAGSPSQAGVFSMRPWRERIRFAGAVFFLFATVGVIAVLINHTAVPMPLYYVLVTMLISGVFAGVFILVFGRLVVMLAWIALFVVIMIGVGRWGSALQKEIRAELAKQPRVLTGEETRVAVEAYQGRVRNAILRDAILTLAMIVLSYIAFIQAFNYEWSRRAAFESELKVARRIQESLLPPAEKRIAGWHMCGVLQPANTVAGDYFDYLEFADGQLGVLVADASGHGVAAGLVMTLIKSQLFSLTSEPHDASKFFERLNQCVRALAPKNMFVTAAYVALPQEQTDAAPRIEFATVGHPPLLRYSAARAAVEELSTSATALGLQTTLRITPRALALQHGDVLLLYTDGVCEQMSAKQEQWGLESLKAELQQHHHLPLSQLCARLVQAGAEFRSYAAAHDDMTLVAIRREA